MKRQKIDEDRQKHEYYNIGKYPTDSRGILSEYHRTCYVNILNSKDRKYHNGDPIKEGDTLELLWKDGRTSRHDVKIESIHDTYCYENVVDKWPYISIDHYGTIIEKVKLTDIEGIKVRKCID